MTRDERRTTGNPQAPLPGPGERLADEDALLRRFARDRSPAAREELVERFMPLARRLASRYASGAEPFEDLLQVASLALVNAVDRFDPERGAAFSTFAVPTILGELKRHFRDRGWSIRIPREVQERILKIERAQAELPAKLGHPPSVGEVAERVHLSEEEVLEAMHAAQSHHAASLESSAPAPAGDESAPLRDRLGEEDPAYEAVEYGAAIADALGRLSRRDRLVLHLRFVEDLTQSEIAERVGVSQMHVSRILRSTLDTLRDQVE